MSNGIEKREVAVSLQNATAKWNDEITDPTLNNVNVTMKSGQLLAVIGPVGSGKVLIIKY
jgi:ABC-type multidrug transport system fused ATPase/permease subunit